MKKRDKTHQRRIKMTEGCNLFVIYTPEGRSQDVVMGTVVEEKAEYHTETLLPCLCPAIKKGLIYTEPQLLSEMFTIEDTPFTHSDMKRANRCRH